MTTLILLDETTYWIYHLKVEIDGSRAHLSLTDKTGQTIAGLTNIQMQTTKLYPEKDKLTAGAVKVTLTINGKERPSRIIGTVEPAPAATITQK